MQHGAVLWTRLLVLSACCNVVAQCVLSLHLKRSPIPGHFPKIVPHFPLDNDAVDLATFNTATPYQRGNQWNQMLYELPTVTHKVGQIFEHARHGYLCAIVAIDPRPTAADTAWILRMGVQSLPHGTDQPFYWCLVDTKDISPAIMAYVPQDSVTQSTPPATVLSFSHPDAEVFFDHAKPEKLAGATTLSNHPSPNGYPFGVATGSYTPHAAGSNVEVKKRGKDAQGKDVWVSAKVYAVLGFGKEGYIVTPDRETRAWQKGKKQRVDAHSIRAVRVWRVGDSIEAKWKKGSVWYPGKIHGILKNGKESALDATVGRNGCKISVHFNDGDKEVLPAKFVRFFGPAERVRRASETDFVRGAVPFDGFTV